LPSLVDARDGLLLVQRVGIVLYGSDNSTHQGAAAGRSAAAGSPAANLLLYSLRGPAFDLIRRHLRKVLLTSQSIIYERGDLLTKAYFPEAGAISLVVVFANGHTIETAMVGRDGMLGGL